jgi:hypothetical protein
MNLLIAACDYLENSNHSSEENHPIGAEAAASILVAIKGDTFIDDSEYQKFIQQEREKNSHKDNILAARWHILFSVIERGDATPAIIQNPPEPGVVAAAILLRAVEPYDPYSIWNPFTQEELERGAVELYADLSNIGTFDKTASLDKIADSMFENRPLTRTELILAMKCNYIYKHRVWAIKVNFNYGNLMRTFRRRCGFEECPCVCSSIEP